MGVQKDFRELLRGSVPATRALIPCLYWGHQSPSLPCRGQLRPVMACASLFILPFLSSISDFFTLPSKPGPLPRPNPTCTSPTWCGDGATVSFSACKPSRCPLTPRPRTTGHYVSDGGKRPSQGVQSPLRGTISAGRHTDARAANSPGSKSLAKKPLTFPCSNLFGHFWEFQRNNRTLLTKLSPTCSSNPSDKDMDSLKSPAPSLLSPSNIVFQPKWVCHHFRVTLYLNCSQWGHQLLISLHTKLCFCLYFKKQQHKQKKSKRINH